MRSSVATALLAAILLTLGCAGGAYRYGPYHGPYPAPGAITAFDSVAWAPHDETKAGAPGFLLPHSTNQAQYKLGTLWLDPGADSVVIYIYGDNRPGFRMMTTRWGVPAVMEIGSPDFKQFLWGIANIPVALVQAVIPKADLFRDTWATLVTHRPSGTQEKVVLKALQKEIDRDPRVSFVVQTGDAVENGQRGGQWELFATTLAHLRQTVPYLASVGNHERTWDALGQQNWNAVMGPPAKPQRYWYAVDFPESLARFVFIDTNVLADPHDKYADSLEDVISREQLTWLDSALAVPARYRFIVMHYPLVTSGHYLSDWKYDESRKLETRRRGRLLEICRRRNVTAVLAGHEHLYQRLYVRGRDGRGFWHISTGGAGAPLYRLSDRERKAALALVLPDSSRVTWNKAHSVYHFSRLTLIRHPVSGDQRIIFDVFQVHPSGKISLLDHADLSQLPPVEKAP